MSTWTNKSTAGTTSWTPDIDNPTTTWDTHDSYDAEASQFGIILSEAGTSGTYTSSAQAAQSFLGSRYKLNDNRNFTFGMDDDVQMRYDTTGPKGLFVLDFNDDALFTLSHGGATLATGLSVGSLTLREQHETLPIPLEGKVIYHNNELYIAKGVL